MCPRILAVIIQHNPGIRSFGVNESSITKGNPGMLHNTVTLTVYQYGFTRRQGVDSSFLHPIGFAPLTCCAAYQFHATGFCNPSCQLSTVPNGFPVPFCAKNHDVIVPLRVLRRLLFAESRCANLTICAENVSLIYKR